MSKSLVKKGYLVKKGGSFKSKKKRWFVLSDDTLTYYENETESKQMGFIPLSDIIKCEVIGNKEIVLKTQSRVRFCRDYELIGEVMSEIVDWLEEIEKRLKKLKGGAPSSPTKVTGTATASPPSPSSPKSPSVEVPREAPVKAPNLAHEELKLLYEEEQEKTETLMQETKKNAKLIQELQRASEKKDQDLLALKAQLDQKTLQQKALEDDAAGAKQAQLEFAKGNVSATEIVTKWEIDSKALTKLRHDHNVALEELASFKARVQVSGYRADRAERKLRQIQEALLN